MSTRSAPASPRKLARARARGDVPLSERAVAAAALISGLATLATDGGGALAWFRAQLISALDPGVHPVGDTVRGSGAFLLSCLVRPLVAAALAATVMAALQTGVLFVTAGRDDAQEQTDSAAPWWERTLVAVALVAGSFACVRAALPVIFLAHARGLLVLVTAMRTVLVRMMALAGAIAAIDLVASRMRHAASLRMTRAEQHREMRETQGDPTVRAARRCTYRDTDGAPGATWLVRDGARVATVVTWSEGGLNVPAVVAHGVGEAARRMEQRAHRDGVRVVHDPRTATALARVAAGDTVPERLFDALAAHVRAMRSR